MQKQGIRKIKYFILPMVLLFFSISCDVEKNSVIPDVSFTYTINLNVYNELEVPGNSVFIPGVAYGGIIVYCELPGSFYAFDATCTYEKNPDCHLKVDGVLGTCECCGSQFILIGGSPSSGNAAWPLKQYKTSVANGILRVYN